MRCRACNRPLTDFESTRRTADRSDYLDMCNRCLSTILDDVETVDNFNNYDASTDDLASVLPTYDTPPEPGDLGAGPDPDEPEDG